LRCVGISGGCANEKHGGAFLESLRKLVAIIAVEDQFRLHKKLDIRSEYPMRVECKDVWDTVLYIVQSIHDTFMFEFVKL
jgi:hypothetical protein